MKRLRYILLLLPVVVMAVLIVLSSRNDDLGDTGKRLRIVSLTPNVTEILFELGLGDCVVGATEYCDYPPEAKGIRRTGQIGSPNLELLVSLKPDIVLSANFTNQQALDSIDQAGIKLVNMKITTFKELYEAIELVGKETQTHRQADELIARMRSVLADARNRFDHIPMQRRPGVFVEIWDDPLQTVGGGSFIDEVVTLAGGVNVAKSLKAGYPTISPEKVLQWNPDVILMSHSVKGGDAKSHLAGRIGFSAIKAVKTGRIIDDIDSDLYLRPGPRLVEGVRALAERLYPVSVEKAQGESRRSHLNFLENVENGCHGQPVAREEVEISLESRKWVKRLPQLLSHGQQESPWPRDGFETKNTNVLDVVALCGESTQ